MHHQQRVSLSPKFKANLWHFLQDIIQHKVLYCFSFTFSWEENTFTALNVCHISGFYCCSFNLVLPSWHTLLCVIVKISFHYHLFFSVFGCFLGTHNNNNVFFFSLEQFKLFKVAPNLQTCQYWILNGRSQAVWVWRRLTMFSVGHRKIFHLHFLAPQTGGEEKRFNPSGFSPLCQFVQQCLITVSISLILSIFCCKEQTWQLLFDTFLVPK